MLFFTLFGENPTFSKLRFFHTLEKIPLFQNYGFFTLWRKSHFFKITVFSHFGENPTFSKLRFFHTFGEITVFSHFYRIPCFFQNFRVFKKIPRSKFIWNSSQKFRLFFKNSPFRKLSMLQIPWFSPKKFRVLQNSPVFIFFKSLKTLEKTMYFCIKTG